MEQLGKQLLSLSINRSGSEESEVECLNCGLVYGCSNDDEVWVQCDNCEQWWDFGCTEISDQDDIPDTFLCTKCKV